MKLKYFICLLVIITSSCSKEIEVNQPDFNVSTTAASFKVDEEVKFNFEGSANSILFYSGEEGNDYEFRNGRAINVENKPILMSFDSSVQGGTQQNQLSILASNDFNGNYTDLASIKVATWTDITTRFSLGTSATFKASGEGSLDDLIATGKPLYIAFKYITKPQAVNGLVRTWMIQNFSISSNVQFQDKNVSLTDQIMAGFRIIEEDRLNTPARSLVTSTRVTLQGNVYKDPADPIYDSSNPIYDPLNPIYDPTSPSYDPKLVMPRFVPYDFTSPYNDPTRENWAVSAGIYASKVDLGPDPSTPLKGLTSGKLQGFTHVFTKPGTYKVHFVAVNVNVDSKKEVLRTITLKITD